MENSRNPLLSRGNSICSRIFELLILEILGSKTILRESVEICKNYLKLFFPFLQLLIFLVLTASANLPRKLVFLQGILGSRKRILS